MRTICFTIASVVASMILVETVASSAYGENVPEAVALIMSSKYAEREQGMRDIQNDRRSVVEALLAIVNSPVKEREEYYDGNTSRNQAIRLLGHLRAKEAVPAIVPWLTPRPEQVLVVDEAVLHAWEALAEIGLPSIGPLLELVRNEGCTSTEVQVAIIEGTSIRYEPPLKRYRELGDRALTCIVRILGGEHTGLLLKNAIAKETDLAKRQNLQWALEFLESPKVSERLKQGGLSGF